ncbi:hypothetical protein B0I08_10698 [Glaciihabitans tibetensis]|uniref:Uncharacterized protein n=1 Tax=Glaciihabitans tibetensis TaxID=1266600 RepID=A0A2T0VBF1_9MICO|nr:hypothetical protein [Glaciihabitans tibetensis]PRY67491.1 hypothetical protein B0I08_10698 [Glaciihabitans tibetensis]
MNVSHSRPAGRTWLASLGAGSVVGIVVATVLALTGVVIPTDAASASSSSAVTVAAADQDADIATAPMPDLKVTVSQTEDLTSQGIVVSWTGGKQSTAPGSSSGGENFLQIAQCWGTDPVDPTAPDRTTCQYGAFNSVGATRDNFVQDEFIAPQDQQFSVPSENVFSPAYASIPFTAVTGEKVASVIYDEAAKKNKKVDVDVNVNQFVTQYTSNEVKWAGSGASGSGSAKFEVQTALQSPGLGCGNASKLADGSTASQSCWLVVIPRGVADAGEQHIINSGLFWDSWKHSVAVKLDFKPIGVNCTIGSAERQLAGSELASEAIGSWQPTLCKSQGGATFNMSKGAESDAAAMANGTVPSPLALTSRPLGTESGTPDALQYAPVALSGVSIGFAIDRQPTVGDVPADVLEKTALPFENINLTPRLLAKLLTNSYLDSLPTYADKKHVGVVSSANQGKNARNLTLDPDFLAINDAEWKYEALISPSLSDLLVSQGRSDAAWQLWRYIMADADAVAFLEGKPDPWGMRVNPWSSTNADVTKEVNKDATSGLVLPRDNFPKADPVEQAASPTLGGAVNLVTWRPYTNDLDQSAYLALRGDGQVLGAWDSTQATPKYGKALRDLIGQQRVLALTDTASAAKYQVVSASLRNAAGKFVAPTNTSLLAAAAAMTATGQAQVYELDPTGDAAKAAPSAYPLAMPVYAALNPAQTDADQRADYATFIRYAATAGQVSGTNAGELPEGYAPIPAGWQTQALSAANIIQSGGVPVQPPASPAPSTPGAAPAAASAVSNAAAAAATGAPSSVTAVSAPTDPGATGVTAASLTGAETPKDPKTGAISAAIPGGVLGGFAAAAAVPLFSRLRRRF